MNDQPRTMRLRTPEQVAAELGVIKAARIRRLIKAGEVPAVILDGRGTVALTDEQVDKIIAKLTKAEAAPPGRPADSPFGSSPRSRASRRRADG